MLDGLLGELLQVKWRTSIEAKFRTWFRCFLAFLAVASCAYATRLAHARLASQENGASVAHLRHLVARAQVSSECLLLCLVLGYLSLLGRQLIEATRQATSRSSRDRKSVV